MSQNSKTNYKYKQMPKQKRLTFKPTIYKLTIYATHWCGSGAKQKEKKVDLRDEVEEMIWNIPAMNLLSPVSVETIAIEENNDAE